MDCGPELHNSEDSHLLGRSGTSTCLPELQYLAALMVVRRLSRAIPLVLLVGVIATFGITGRSPRSIPQSTNAAKIDCHSLPNPCPPALPPRTLQTEDDSGALGLGPPPESAEPVTTAEEAMNIAWAQDAEQSTAQEPVLALVLPGGTFPKPLLVWEIRYTGACLHASGPSDPSQDYSSPEPCGNTEWDTIIDASTGAFVYGFTTH